MILEGQNLTQGVEKLMHQRANRNTQLTSPKWIFRFNRPLDDASELVILADYP